MTINNNSGVYRIVHIDSGREYIGSTDSLSRRWREHRSRLRRGIHDSRYLQYAWNKYGENAFAFEIIEECLVEELLIREQWFMDTKKPVFNSAPLASGSRGIKRSPELRARISQALLGNQNNLGRVPSQETRDKISTTLTGYKHSSETRAKMSAAQKGKTISPEAKANMSAAKKGKPLTPAHRASLSKAQLERNARLRAEQGESS
jgi:hypothetical protein